MRIGIVSDTHGHVTNAAAAVRLLKTLDVAAVLHCGDIGSPAIVTLFDAWPTHFVFGNVDGEERLLHNAIENAGQSCHGQFGSIELGGRRIALLHSHDARLFQETVAGGEWDLVCYGHTHVAKQESINGTLAVNPGALFRARQHTIAVVDLDSMSVEHIPL